MANTIAPFGFLDFNHQGGSQRTEELKQVWVASSDATPIFYGDPVQTLTYVSTAGQNSGFGPYVTQATSATTNCVGVFRGCELFNSALNKMYYSRYFPGQSAAGTSSQTGDIKAYIQADRTMRFIVQASSGGILGSSNIGQLLSVAASTGVGGSQTPAVGNPSSNVGNTTTGNSGVTVLSSASTAITAISSQTGLGTTSSLVFQLVDFYSNWGPGLLPGQVPGTGTGQFVNGMDNTTAGQYVIVQPWNWNQF